MPTLDQKNTSKTNQKRGSLTGDKTKKFKKKKKSKKSSTCKSDSKDSGNNLEIEGSGFQNEDVEDSDESSLEIKTKSPPVVVPKLSTSGCPRDCETTPRPLSTDSHSTHSSSNRQTECKPTKPQSKSADSISARLSNISLKNKASKSKSKACQSAKKDSAKTKKTGPDTKPVSLTSSSSQNITETSKGSPHINESIRWENSLDNPDSERERIHLYKINRRKRYLAAAQMKGLGWVKQYGVNGFPLSEESNMADVRKDNSVITDLSTVAMLRNSHSLIGEGKALTLGH